MLKKSYFFYKILLSQKSNVFDKVMKTIISLCLEF